MTGEKILNYKLENLTDEDQLFRSFLATHTQFDKKVIIKSVKPFRSEEERVAFSDEIRKLSQIQHPGIITIYDQLESGEDNYLVFEHVDGKTLTEYIHKISGPIPEEKTKNLFVKILDAFIYAHQKGIMNGAINPGNLIVTKDGNIKVLEVALSSFILAKTRDEAETLAYLSPEYLSDATCDQRSDIYSLGVILFQMLSGKNPYDGLQPDMVRIQIQTRSLPPVKEFYPVVSEDIQAIINKATAKNPLERYASCEEMKQALQKIIHDVQSKSEIEVNEKGTPVVAKALPKEVKIFYPLPYIFIILLSVAGVSILIYNFTSLAPQTSIVYELKNREYIKNRQDSIAKAKEKQAMDDSLRIFVNSKKKDSVEIHYHKFRLGESLESIARMYYNPLDTLLKINGFTGKEKLKRDEAVKVRLRAIYKIQKGENIFQIARLFNLNPLVLKQVNRHLKEFDEEGNPVNLEGKLVYIPLIGTKPKKP